MTSPNSGTARSRPSARPDKLMCTPDASGNLWEDLMEMESISVRPMRREDVNAVYSHEEAEWGAEGWSRESIFRSLGEMFVAHSSDVVIGYISHDGGARKRFKGALFIDALLTCKPYRRQGIAKMMVDFSCS